MLSSKAIENLKEQYPPGTKLKLIRMDDVQAPPAGTIGSVVGVDDVGSIHMAWQTGSLFYQPKLSDPFHS